MTAAASAAVLAPAAAGRAHLFSMHDFIDLPAQALSDMAALNRTDAASPETQEAEKRLREQLAGRGPRPGSAPGAAASRAPPASNSSNSFHIPIKATCESGAFVHVCSACGKADSGLCLLQRSCMLVWWCLVPCAALCMCLPEKRGRMGAVRLCGANDALRPPMCAYTL